MVIEVIKGILYRVKTFRGLKEIELFFTHRDANKVAIDGLTNEDLIQVVLMRQKYQQEQKASGEMVVQIRHLEGWLESNKHWLINKKLRGGKIHTK